MGDVIEKVRNEVPKSFVRLYILLATHLAKAATDFGITIQTVFFLPFLKMRHVLLVLLNKQRNAL